MTAHARAIAVASIVAIGIASGIASGQSDPTACPAGWQRAFNRIDIPETGRSGAKIRRPLAAGALTVVMSGLLAMTDKTMHIAHFLFDADSGVRLN